MNLILVSKRKGEEIYLCPFCVTRSAKKTPDLKGHLHVNKTKGVYNCFRCGASPKATGYIPVLPDYPKRIFKELEEKEKAKTPSGFVPLRESGDDFFPYYIDYAIKRGVTDEDISKYNMGFDIDPYSPFYGRLIFHFYDDSGKLTFLQGRAISEDLEPKYWSNGIKTLGKSFSGSVSEGLIVEGFFDLIKSSRIIPTGAIFSHRVKDKNMKFLITKSFKSRIFLAIDSDVPGAFISFIREFSNREIIPLFLHKKDIGDMTVKETRRELERVGYIGCSGTYNNQSHKREGLL